MECQLLNRGLVIAAMLLVLGLSCCSSHCDGNFSEEARLTCFILSDYNPSIRPRSKADGKTKVDFGMTLIQIIGISEKEEQLTTTLYMTYQWTDERLRWNLSDYSGINKLRVPVDSIWTPDIILENSKDGNMLEALRVNALVRYDGFIEWLPPAIYKTSCIIEISLFPFDWQNCSLVFRSASFDQSQMTFALSPDYSNTVWVDKNAFVPNGEWDLIQRPVKIYERPHDHQFQKIRFYFIVKRRAQFYVLNMLLPCVVLSLLSCFTFCLPVTAGEKISLSISLLLGDTIFAYLFVQRMPSTSLAVPFAASYLLFSMVLLAFCIFCCVVVYNLHFRSHSTHKMPRWMKEIFLDRVGPLLNMKQPDQKWIQSTKGSQSKSAPIRSGSLLTRDEINQKSTRKAPSQILFDNQGSRFGFAPRRVIMTPIECSNDTSSLDLNSIPAPMRSAPKRLKSSVEKTNFIARRIRASQQKEMVMDDWAYMAMILDRFFMWIYLFWFVFGTVGYYLHIVAYKYPKYIP